MKCNCLKCGYTWESRAEKPRACPACKMYRWDEPKAVKKGRKAKAEVK